MSTARSISAAVSTKKTAKSTGWDLAAAKDAVPGEDDERRRERGDDCDQAPSAVGRRAPAATVIGVAGWALADRQSAAGSALNASAGWRAADAGGGENDRAERAPTHRHVVPGAERDAPHPEGVFPKFTDLRDTAANPFWRAGSGARPAAVCFAAVSDETLRIIPLGGLGEVGKNMTVFEIGGETIVIDAGLAFPRDEHLGVDLILPDFGYLQGPRGAGGRSSRTRTRITSARCRTSCARFACKTVLATRLTLGLVKSKLDEHGLLNAAELREVGPDSGPDRRSGPFRARARADVALGPGRRRASASRRRPAGSSTRATGSSTTPRSTACAPTSASSPSSGTAASTCCSATRRTPSARASRAPSGSSARRSGRSSPPGTAAILDLVVRVEHPPDAAGDRRRGRGRALGERDRPLDAQEPEHRAQPRLHRGARRPARPARRPRRASARAPADPLHRLAGRAALGAHADRLQRPSRPCRSSAATP